ncbi:MAG TPA: PspC domain-containing protein [Steroidobacteraceae bacterium]|jgi:phage shock protein PspC (stress-responsive transcriptional regulator)|nr:PspC domain-containing protein [Steroidobacteraceae bacterium]
MSLTEELERLQALRERGALSEAEYERAKERVLGDAAAAYNATAAGGGATGAPGMGPAPSPSTSTDSGPFATERSFFRQLARSRNDRWIGGVCGGLGRHTALPSWAWRLIFCLVALYFGSGILFYVLLWIFLPTEN